MSTNEKPDQEQLDKWIHDPKNYKFKLFYYNPKDPRMFPPKRIKFLGWTMNFANKNALLIALATLGVLYVLVKFF